MNCLRQNKLLVQKTCSEYFEIYVLCLTFLCLTLCYVFNVLCLTIIFIILMKSFRKIITKVWFKCSCTLDKFNFVFYGNNKFFHGNKVSFDIFIIYFFTAQLMEKITLKIIAFIRKFVCSFYFLQNTRRHYSQSLTLY